MKSISAIALIFGCLFPTSQTALSAAPKEWEEVARLTLYSSHGIVAKEHYETPGVFVIPRTNQRTILGFNSKGNLAVAILPSEGKVPAQVLVDGKWKWAAQGEWPAEDANSPLGEFRDQHAEAEAWRNLFAVDEKLPHIIDKLDSVPKEIQQIWLYKDWSSLDLVEKETQVREWVDAMAEFMASYRYIVWRNLGETHFGFVVPEPEGAFDGNYEWPEVLDDLLRDEYSPPKILLESRFREKTCILIEAFTSFPTHSHERVEFLATDTRLLFVLGDQCWVMNSDLYPVEKLALPPGKLEWLHQEVAVQPTAMAAGNMLYVLGMSTDNPNCAVIQRRRID